MTRHEDADPRRPRRRMRWGPAACLAALALLALPSLAAAKCTPIPGRSAPTNTANRCPAPAATRPTPAAASTAAPAAALRCRRAWPATWPPPAPMAARCSTSSRTAAPPPPPTPPPTKPKPIAATPAARRRQPRGRQRQQPPPRRQERRQHRPQHRPHLPLDTDRHSPTPHRPRLAPLPRPPPLTERSDRTRDAPRGATALAGSGCQRRLTWRSTSRGTERTRMRPCSSTNGSRTRMRCLTDT